MSADSLAHPSLRQSNPNGAWPWSAVYGRGVGEEAGRHSNGDGDDGLLLLLLLLPGDDHDNLDLRCTVVVVRCIAVVVNAVKSLDDAADCFLPV